MEPDFRIIETDDQKIVQISLTDGEEWYDVGGFPLSVEQDEIDYIIDLITQLTHILVYEVLKMENRNDTTNNI
jgi:hypothetical protein